MIALGEALRLEPNIRGFEHKTLPCRVVWIHPRRRHYLVEFVFPRGIVRESFPMPRGRTEDVQPRPGYHTKWN